jgi:hypothetical protein
MDLTYSKIVDVGRLTQEIAAAGLTQAPGVGGRFYGAGYDSSPQLATVFVLDDFSPSEITVVDGIIASHVPTPLPPSPSVLTLISASGITTTISVDDDGVIESQIPTKDKKKSVSLDNNLLTGSVKFNNTKTASVYFKTSVGATITFAKLPNIQLTCRDNATQLPFVVAGITSSSSCFVGAIVGFGSNVTMTIDYAIFQRS